MLSAVIIESRSLTARPTGCETRRQVNGKNAPPLETWIGMNTGFLMCLAVAFCVLQWWRRGWRKESWRTKYGWPGREPMIARRRLTRRSERFDIINVELDDITSLFCLETNTRHHTTPPRLRPRLPWPPHDQSRFKKQRPSHTIASLPAHSYRRRPPPLLSQPALIPWASAHPVWAWGGGPRIQRCATRFLIVTLSHR
jgi:hypothetical protein